MSYYTPEPQRSNYTCLYIFIGTTVAALLVICCVAIVGVLGGSAILAAIDPPTVAADVVSDNLVTSTPLGATSTPFAPTVTSTPRDSEGETVPPKGGGDGTIVIAPSATPGPIPDSPYNVPNAINQQPIPATAFETERALLALNLPVHDYYESVSRLTDDKVGSRTIPGPAYQEGDTQEFITDQGVATAELVVITENTYFWIDEKLNLDRDLVLRTALRFETDFYPLIVNLFGPAWLPGMDEDPHVSILHLESFAGSELGFFDSGDEYPQTVASASNEQEIFYLNMDALDMGSALYYGTLIHEFQHVAQWNADGNEAVWLDEGLAQLGEIYTGHLTADYIDYLDNPDTQLNTWNYEDDDAIFAHYAAGFLFSTYLWEQLGDVAIQELFRSPANGIQAVAEIVAGHDPYARDLAGFYSDWAVANWLDDPDLDPRYGYNELRLDSASITEFFPGPGSGIYPILPFSTNYIDLDLSGPTTITFAGDTMGRVVPTTPRSGELMWLTPPTDNVDAQLTGRFDLTTLSSATLTFWAWYDLEVDFDFAYVSASTDNGATWQLLFPERSVTGSFGPALNGFSGDEFDNVNGWVPVTVPLNQVTGNNVLIRIELLTDGGITGGGMAIDDIQIPELGYGHDAEQDDGGWEAAGFIRSNSAVPHNWRLQLIDTASGTVTPIPLDDRFQGQITLDIGNLGGILVVSTATPFVFEEAAYWVEVTQ